MSDWIEWNGGECPVAEGTRVEVEYQGDEGDDVGHEIVNDPTNLTWAHTRNGLGDILRYRVLAEAMILPSDPAERKGLPITTGVLDYFPRALAEVARVSKAGNDQHNPGQPLHWSKGKSTDHADCIPRHLIDRHTRDADGQRHSAKLAWRALALLETELEKEAMFKPLDPKDTV